MNSLEQGDTDRFRIIIPVIEEKKNLSNSVQTGAKRYYNAAQTDKKNVEAKHMFDFDRMSLDLSE